MLRTAAAVGATGILSGLAGCSQVADRLPVGGGGDQVRLVPEDAESVTYVDASAVLNDPATKQLMNAYIDELSSSDYYDGPDDYEEAREEWEDETDLPPSEVEYQVSFSEYSDYGVVGQYYGTIAKAGWDEDEVVENYEDNYRVEYDDDDYEDHTVYVADSDYVPAIGVLEEGLYVTGPVDAIEDVIDVKRGEEDPLDDPLKSGYTSTRSAPVRYVGEMPPSIQRQDEVRGPEGEVYSLEAVQDAEYASGSVYKSGNKRGVRTTIRADDESDARDIEDLMSGYISVLEGQEDIDEEAEEILETVTVERNGRDVVVSYEATVDRLEELLEAAFEDSGSSSVETNVQAGASVTSDGDEVRVTWTSNQNADYLVAAVSGCDETEAQLDVVGDSATFTNCASDVFVRVTGYTDEGEATVIFTKEVET